MASSLQPHVHIVTCFNTSCDERYSRMCDDLESKGVVCVVEGRGDYGLGSIPFKDKFKEMVDTTLYTVIHLCPKMIERLEQVMHILENERLCTKFVYIHTDATPEDIPRVYKEATKMTLYNDTHHNNIVKRLADTVLSSAPPPSPKTPKTEPKVDDSGNDDLDEPADDTSHDEVFVNCAGSFSDRDRGVYYLSKKIKCTPHPLLKYTTQEDLHDMRLRAELYTLNSRANTVRWLVSRVIPEVSRKRDIGSMIELLCVPVSQIRSVVLGLFRDVLLSTKPNDIPEEHLRAAEKVLFEHVLTVQDSKQPRSAADIETLCVYFVTLLHRMVISLHGNASMNSTYTRILQHLSQSPGDAPNVNDIKTFVEYMKTNPGDLIREITSGSLKETPTKRSWVLKFAAVLGTLVQVFHDDHQTKLKALDTLSKIVKPLKSGHIKPKKAAGAVVVGKLVTLGMVTYLHSLEEITGEDIDDRTKAAFKVLRDSPEIQKELFKTMRSLLFSHRDVIRNEALTMVTDTQSYSEIMVADAVESMQPINIDLTECNLNKEKHNNGSWMVYTIGRLSERVMLHVNIPRDSYHNQKKAKSTVPSSDSGHCNTVDILRTLAPHENILSLWAYRIDHIPMFYVTEDYSQPDFHRVLYYKVVNKRWLRPLDLLQLLLQALDAVIYLHENGIIHRDVTASSFSYNKEQNSLKLCTFQLTRKCGRDQTIVDRDYTGIPIRWSAPESLNRCFFSFRSDCWMLGHLIYEIITHGSLPYSDLGEKTEAEIAELIKNGTKLLCHERCIPTKVFETIVECTKFADDHRLSACEAKCKLVETLDDYSQPDLKAKLCPVNLESVFPPANRISRGEKHRGQAGEYATVRVIPRTTSLLSIAQMEAEKDEVQLTPNNLFLRKHPTVFHVEETETKLEIKEYLKRPLTASEESLFLTHNFAGLHDHVTVVKYEDGEALSYSIPVNCQGNLRRLIENRVFGSDLLVFIDCLRVVAKTLAQLHGQNWVHGCLSAENIWIVLKSDQESEKYQVYLSELAYMRQSQDNGGGITVTTNEIVGAPTEDKVYRRSAPEVMQNGIYTPAGDVYSFGLVIWDILNTLSQHPATNILKNTEIAKLYEYLTTKPGGEILPKPNQCPDEVYSLLVTCWSPERYGRPKMDMVEQKLFQYIISRTHQEPDTSLYESVNDDSEEDELYESIYDQEEHPKSLDRHTISESSSELFMDHPSSTTTTESRSKQISDVVNCSQSESSSTLTLVGPVPCERPVPPPKRHLKKLNVLGNERDGKGEHMSRFLTSAQSQSDTKALSFQPGSASTFGIQPQTNIARQVPNIDNHSANILKFKTSYRQSVCSLDKTLELSIGDTSNSETEQRNSVVSRPSPAVPPKPKVSTGNTVSGSASSQVQVMTKNMTAIKKTDGVTPRANTEGVLNLSTRQSGSSSPHGTKPPTQKADNRAPMHTSPAGRDGNGETETPAADRRPPVPPRPPPNRRPSNSSETPTLR